MRNIPRIFIDKDLKENDKIEISPDILHYLTRVMRTDKCLVFGNGLEFNAVLESKVLIVGENTGRPDPSGNWTFCFAPIKKTDDMLNMATQMGVANLQPVITDRTNTHHVNWARITKIITEAAEQSNRNSIPKLLPPIKFCDLDKSRLIFADERAAYDKDVCGKILPQSNRLLIGPEGGFSDSEFAALDASGAIGISLGKTILRAEVAAIAALSKVI